MKYILLCLLPLATVAQNVGIGTTTPHSSAALEIKTNNKGVLLPTMTADQRNAIASPAKGLMVYDSTNNAHYYFTGNQWKPVGASLFKADSSLNIGNQVKTIQHFNMTNGYQVSFDTSGFLYDNGGPSGNYTSNLSQSFTIQTSGALGIIIELQELETESFYDSLRITVNGVTRRYWGSQTDSIYIAGLKTNVEILFNSNHVTNMAGFKLRWKKILIAGNTVAGYDSTQKSGWYYNEVKQYMRGGINLFNNWHPDSSGIGSFSFGQNSQAKGYGSFSAGLNTSAAGDHSIAAGYNSNATGNYGTLAIGWQTIASGEYGAVALGDQAKATGSSGATALGQQTTASGNNGATAMGFYSTASGSTSFAMGSFAEASGNNSNAMGYQATASGLISTAIGNHTTASGSYSTAIGVFTEAKSFGGMAIGSYNDNANPQSNSSFNPLNRIFEIGNGTNSFTRGNAMTVLQNGNVGIGVLSPGQQLSIAKGMNIDESNVNSGTIFNSLRFGSNSGEAIASKRTASGNQFGLDFYTNSASRMSITQNGNVGIGTSMPSQMFSVAAGMNIDQNNGNTGTVDNSLRFGNNSGEAIASKRTVGANQHGLDFFTANTNRMSISNNGNVGIGNATPSERFEVTGNGRFSGNIVVQSNKGIIRSTDGIQRKQLSAGVTINTNFLAGETKTFTVTWPESFAASPEAYVGNVTAGTGGWAEVVMTVFGTNSSGATLYVYNPKSTSATVNFTVRVIAIGAQ